ncbi:MAG: chemotaxis protein CheD [Bacteriovoracaceae bacterium]|nr:chemotaxis protein CheD [Bacteriovoracaceae bacterium]
MNFQKIKQKIVAGISEMKISTLCDDVLVTYSLGSCVGVTIYDPVKCIGGIIHCMLPLSKIDSKKAQDNPFMFVDIGVPLFINSLFECGVSRKNMIIKVAGGSLIMDKKGKFKIGERNYMVLRKLLWKNNMLISGEDVGGKLSRTMSLVMATGKTFVKSDGMEKEL